MATVTPIPAALGVNCHDTLQNMYSTTLPPRPKVVTATQFASDDFKVQTLPSPSRAAFLRPEGLGLFTHTYPSNGLWPSKGSKEQTVSFENKLLTVQVITAAEGFVLISTSQLPRQISHVCFRTLLLTNNLARRTRGRCRVTRIRENRSRGECIDGCSQSSRTCLNHPNKSQYHSSPATVFFLSRFCTLLSPGFDIPTELSAFLMFYCCKRWLLSACLTPKSSIFRSIGKAGR